MRPFILSTLIITACVDEGMAPEVDDASAARVVAEYTRHSAGMLALLNDPATTVTTLDIDAALDRRAATNLINYRNGRDLRVGTRDDNRFDTVAEADAVPYVGDVALAQILAYAAENGFIPDGGDPYATIEGVPFTWDEATATLDFANTASLVTIDVDAALDARAANAIVAGRPFVTMERVAAAAYVGRTALERLKAYTIANPVDAYTTDEAVADLTATSNGLWYTSESDYPFTVFTVPGAGYDPVTVTNAKLKLGSAYENRPGEATLAARLTEQRTIADIFDRMTVPQVWWDPSYYADAARWQALRDVFDTQLSDVTVIRFGDSLSPPTLVGSIDVFILGVTADGDIVGVKTIAVET